MFERKLSADGNEMIVTVREFNVKNGHCERDPSRVYELRYRKAG